jgi:hypothetical protein
MDIDGQALGSLQQQQQLQQGQQQHQQPVVGSRIHKLSLTGPSQSPFE